MEDTRTPTNQRLGELLGVSHAMVSRYRSGTRLPSLKVMDKIRELYGWTVDEQIRARKTNTYAKKFRDTVSGKVNHSEHRTPTFQQPPDGDAGRAVG